MVYKGSTFGHGQTAYEIAASSAAPFFFVVVGDVGARGHHHRLRRHVSFLGYLLYTCKPRRAALPTRAWVAWA